LFRSLTSKVSALSDGVAKGQQTIHCLPLPLVKPDVRSYRIRLTDDHSAIGIRKELTALNSQVDKPCGPQCLIQGGASKLLTSPLAPRPQKVTQPDLHIPVHLAAGQAGMAKAEIIAPAAQKSVQSPDQCLQRGVNPTTGHFPQSLPYPIHRFGRRNNIKVLAATIPVPIKAGECYQKIHNYAIMPPEPNEEVAYGTFVQEMRQCLVC